MPTDLSLFWSYAHVDDSSDHGRITLLAQHLASEIRVISGLEVDLFVDRKSLQWGDEWRTNIDRALTASTFFVPILSPTYFQQIECRNEFINFYREAKSRALDNLLLPLSYTPVSDFKSTNPDEIVAIASSYEFEDWSRLRLKDPTSEGYRSGVNKLATRIIGLHHDLSDQEQVNSGRAQDAPNSPELGFYEALEEIANRLDKWQELVRSAIVHNAQLMAIGQVYSKRLNTAPASKELAIRHGYATDGLKLANELLELARNYSSLSVEMAPFVATVLRGASDWAPGLETLRPLYEAVAEAREEVVREYPVRMVTGEEYWGRFSKLGGVFKLLFDCEARAAQYREEGNTLLLDWHADLSTLFEAQSQ
ncbi:toll/interleukin-1 receptor domain-containing protein [Salinibacterium sp. NSLL150]|uniref:toll/interleukin-1 receptor domain-containing protein n=1 Tax=unclassified Salinibacterium TaxID=2632331 RepID=UPI0018CFD2EA|nr:MULTISPECIES: toll/interleukin-1 receptor domain-containing protein [unclassified Salinibacterium]MBH0098779.1 toll/interleukin-1 receptor domain-containing protein [Salinibacterium sp. NSLL35]MBH0101534.1 toll/interleukin-1 receptor domain-containing protein [Salinibacterium sp. NSLL150]MBH0104293.1 toll/interleukin-1 receptor domain-containing protein [Salinibacterium sp. NSLL16]MBH0107054.1 toll/interleukin-1 receptor domain-containing protein [Salinibacterium sp. NSLL17]